MPSIGAAEIVIILVLALLVFGPKRLPEMGRSLGRTVREFKKASDTARKELGVDEIEKEIKGVKQSLADAGSDLKIDIDAETAKPAMKAATTTVAATGLAGPATPVEAEEPGDEADGDGAEILVGEVVGEVVGDDARASDDGTMTAVAGARGDGHETAPTAGAAGDA